MIGGWTNIFKSNDLELYYFDFEISSENQNSYITKEKEVL